MCRVVTRVLPRAADGGSKLLRHGGGTGQGRQGSGAHFYALFEFTESSS